MPISAQELAAFDRTRPWVDKSWADMTWQERFQLGDVLNAIGNFFQIYQRSLLSLGAIGLLVFVVEVLKAILATVNQVPLLPALFEVVGLGYTIWYGKRNLWDASNRRQLWQQIRQLKQDIVGAPRLVGITEVTDVAVETVEHGAESRSQMFAGVVGTIQVLIPLAGLVDVDALRAKLAKKLDKAENDIKSLTGRLGNVRFVSQAPAAVVQEVRDSLVEAQKQSEIIRDRLSLL
jgi:valyl-tRNA synthetase